jgi:hypothetical protein
MRTFDLTRNQGNNAILFTRFPLVAQALKLVAVPCGPQRRPVPQNKTSSNTYVSQHFLPIDYEPKIKSRKHTLSGVLRSAACGGALRRCAAPSAAAWRSAPPLRGAKRPARCARNLSGTMRKNALICLAPQAPHAAANGLIHQGTAAGGGDSGAA